jgi:hypothetical protein
MINHVFDRAEVRRHAHTAIPSDTAATNTAVEGNISTGRQTHNTAIASSAVWAARSGKEREAPLIRFNDRIVLCG